MVLLHGLGEQSATWESVIPELDLSFRVVTIDFRGHGDSDWPGQYSFELMRDDVVRVLEQLGLERVTLVGHSMGGVVAYLVASGIQTGSSAWSSRTPRHRGAKAGRR